MNLNGAMIGYKKDSQGETVITKRNSEILEEISELGINTFVTGITVLSPRTQEAHGFAKENRINVLGGTHYSTEKFACMEMCKLVSL